MTAKSLALAIEALSSLPAADQERLARQILTYIEKLLLLRVEIGKGVRATEVGASESLDLKAFLRRKNARHGGA